jgi:hypothetical protein
MKTLGRDCDRVEILQRLKRVRPDHVGRWGRMSAHGMICHLSDSLLMAAGQKPVSDATGVLHRTILKWVVLYAPLKWPVGVPTRPEIDQELGGTKPTDFMEDMARLEALLEHMTRSESPSRPVHPIFGGMSEAAWRRWAYLHIDHHLRQFGA